MRYNTTKRKLLNAWEREQKNQIELGKKENNALDRKLNPDVVKAPKTIFDTGWISIPERQGASFVKPTDITSQFDSAQEGFPLPAQLTYDFDGQITMEEHLVSFIKPIILIRPNPDSEVSVVDTVPTIIYDTRPFLRVTGDGNLVYQGYVTGTDNVFSQGALDNGDFLVANTSKWFVGDIRWTDFNNDLWEIIGGRLRTVTFEINVTGPGDFDRFTTSTIDNLTGSTITGQGTLQHFENSILISTSKCVDQTGSLFASTTVLVVFGLATKNGTPVTLANWTIDQGSDTIVLFDFNFGGYKLHYTSKRVREISISPSTSPTPFRLSNLPVLSDCDTDPRIVTQFRLEGNPEGFPKPTIGILESDGLNFKLLEEFDPNVDIPFLTILSPAHRFLWFKDPPSAGNSFRWRAKGNVFLSGIPASVPSNQTVIFIDETYSKTGGSYSFNGLNRPGKTVLIYKPFLNEAQIRIKLVAIQPFHLEEIVRLNKENQ